MLVGSSMGGWIALLLARALPDRIAGLVGIAAAPDFTEDSMWAQAHRADSARPCMRDGQIELPVGLFRRALRHHPPPDRGWAGAIWCCASRCPCPSRCACCRAPRIPTCRHRSRCACWTTPTGPDIRLTLVKDADHRFSTPACLDADRERRGCLAEVCRMSEPLVLIPGLACDARSLLPSDRRIVAVAGR